VASTYRIGILIVLLTILISAGLCWAWAGSGSPPSRAGQQLAPGAFPLGQFQLVERSGRSISQQDLAGRVCIASFIFTRCPLSCPRITSVMRSLQERLSDADVLLLSISVDPEYDTPAVLADYARRFSASPDRWWFLTGSTEQIYDLVRGRFKLPLMELEPGDRQTGRENITHSDRLALIEDNQVAGLFDSTDPAAVDSLVARARRLARPRWLRLLPGVNASLNATCAVLLLLGWISIRRPGRADPIQSKVITPARRFLDAIKQPAIRGHVICMLAALTASALFLTSYLIYHSQVGSVAFQGAGLLRIGYLTILMSHTVLATLGVVPLVAVTVVRALRGNFIGHKHIARITFPIWLYVSMTGVIIYLLLYHLPSEWSSSWAGTPH
jgi:protein SCO1/2/putative membrane protein